jgi:natural product biosynthesis luciferase-like monooxygenase protein
MRFSVMFFAALADRRRAGQYELMLQVARRVDNENFTAVWTPERHFHQFGGIFPNAAITSAALATITQRLQLRAGSVISPLHHPVRIAEDWSMVDNLSGGRAAVSFGSGWNVNDFVLYPDRFRTRKAIMYEHIDLIRRLWRGETLILPNALGNEVEITLLPRPLQPSLPVWVTSSGQRDTFMQAGRSQANILTHLVGQDLRQLAGKIADYRAAGACCVPPFKTGVVTLMLHTYLDSTVQLARAKARPALRAYLQDALELESRSAAGGQQREPAARDPGLMAELLDFTVDRYLDGQSLIGTVDSIGASIEAFGSAGVDELACLVDFGLDDEDVLRSLRHLTLLANRYG